METEAQPDNIVKETDFILVIENRGNRVISNIKKDKSVNFRKKKIKLSSFVGHPYGSTFEIAKNGDVKLVTDTQAEPFEEDGSAGEEDDKEDEVQGKANKEELNDNRDMVDNNKAQKLTQAEIDQMKKEGVEGQQIIEKLLENSESFNKRTAFSQEKYLLKKKKKHLFQIKVEKVTLDSAVETYFLKNQSYILNFRYDSLALFLQMAGIVPKSKILLFDNTHGLVLGGVKQRLGDEGEIHVCSSRPEKQMANEFRILTELGYTADNTKNINYIALKDLEANPTKFSHLLIASEINPIEILAATINYVLGGGTIVIFNQFLEPLGDCFEYLRQPPLAINMFIKEVFSREMQVLPERTHPFMMMQSFSGFILSGNRILG